MASHTPGPLAIATSPVDRRYALLAYLGGELRVNDKGCLYLRAGTNAVDIVWPRGYTAEMRDDGTVVVRRGDGRVVAATGRSFNAGGGFVDVSNDVVMPCRAASGEIALINDMHSLDAFGGAQGGAWAFPCR